MRSLLTGLVPLLAIALGAACDDGAFVCERDDECGAGRRAGTCEPQGFCSFADPQCESGKAWGEHAPEVLANECVPPADEADPCGGALECTSDEPRPASPPNRDDGATPAHRDAEPGGSNGVPDDVPLLPPNADHCGDGEQSGDESDVDCGGSCGPCGWCAACFEDGDCGKGSCHDGVCRTIEVLELDWLTDCGPVADFTPNLVLPPGTYRALALPSAGSKWDHDAAAGGLTWAWRIDCDGASFGDLRTPGDERFATPEAAFAALQTDETFVQLDPDANDPSSASLACGIADTFCDDNRGGVAVLLENWCP